MKKETWKKSPWVIPIVFFLLTVGNDKIKDKPFFSTIWSALKWIGDLSLKILNFKLRLWWVIIFIGLSIFIIYVIRKIKGITEFRPEFDGYKSDEIEGLKWSWDWFLVNKSTKTWNITNLQALCPLCDTPLIFKGGSYNTPYYECSRCKHKPMIKLHDQNIIELLITDNVKKGSYKKST